MANVTKKPSRWGKPTTSDKQDRRERRISVLGNLATLLLTGIIIVGGFMLPAFLYPYLDFYHEDLIQLTNSPEQNLEGYTFDNPVVLYPWNVYEENLLRPLSQMERDSLQQKEIPAFLLANMRDRGLRTDRKDDEYLTQILNSFAYLEPRDTNYPACYVLVNFDISRDGRPDLRCAVGLSGNIIDMLFLSPEWDSVTVEYPIGMSKAPDDKGQANGNENSPPTSTGQTGTGQAGTGQTGAGQTGTGQTGTGQTGTGQAGTGQNEADKTGAAGENPAADPGANKGAAGLNPAIEHPPVEEERTIWSFAYATSREAQRINQQSLFRIFRQVEFYYETRYGYPYTLLLPNQSPDAEVLPEVDYVSLTPQPLRTDQYRLYIYNLPSGEQLILYLDPVTPRCIGFTLLL